MDNFWIFFRDTFGQWQWERHGAGCATVAVSNDSFPNPHDCRHDAIHHGYLPFAHEAIYPPDFEQGLGQADTRAR